MSSDRGETKGRDAINVFVDGRHFQLINGMTVRHALLAAGMTLSNWDIPSVLDEWGNLTGLEGALYEGIKLFTPQAQ